MSSIASGTVLFNGATHGLALLQPVLRADVHRAVWRAVGRPGSLDSFGDCADWRLGGRALAFSPEALADGFSLKLTLAGAAAAAAAPAAPSQCAHSSSGNTAARCSTPCPG